LKHSALRTPEHRTGTLVPPHWLDIHPRDDLALAPHEFRAAIRQYLDLSPQDGNLFACTCGKTLPAKDAASHQQICRSKHGYTVAHRHDHVRDVFRQVCQAHGIATTFAEPRGFVPETAQGPDVIAFTARKQFVIDFCVLYPLAASNVQAEARELGGSLTKASETKHRHYTDHCKAHQQFVTFGLSTFGLFAQEALNCVSALARHVARPTAFTNDLMRALVIAVHRGNARLAVN
jgi:hypothetical protein